MLGVVFHRRRILTSQMAVLRLITSARSSCRSSRTPVFLQMDLSVAGTHPSVGYLVVQDIGDTGKVVRDTGVEVDTLRSDSKTPTEGVGTGRVVAESEREEFVQYRDIRDKHR